MELPRARGISSDCVTGWRPLEIRDDWRKHIEEATSLGYRARKEEEEEEDTAFKRIPERFLMTQMSHPVSCKLYEPLIRARFGSRMKYYMGWMIYYRELENPGEYLWEKGCFKFWKKDKKDANQRDAG
ncbi:uncharacterized protein isoform X2 [Rhodnius prolixus]